MTDAPLRIPSDSSDTAGRLMTAEEIGRLLNLPVHSVWRLARQGDLPVLRVGRLLRFDFRRVMAALEGQKGEH